MNPRWAAEIAKKRKVIPHGRRWLSYDVVPDRRERQVARAMGRSENAMAKAIVKPFYEQRGVSMYHGDSLKIMRTLPAEFADAVVVDPPFGIGFTFGETREEANTAESYWQWFEPFFFEMMRLLRPGGFFACWQSQMHFRHFWDWFGSDIHIYCAAKNFVQLRPTPINYGYDPVVMFYKPGDPLRPKKPARSIDFYLSNTAGIISSTHRLEKGHPCPKPVDLMHQVISNFTLPAGVILDPFSGSFSTGVAALLAGRSFVGIEREKKYVEIGLRRLSAASLSLVALEQAELVGGLQPILLQPVLFSEFGTFDAAEDPEPEEVET